MMTSLERCKVWETLWANYMAKLQRRDDLRAVGRSGYQLKMPTRAVILAWDAIELFDALDAAE